MSIVTTNIPSLFSSNSPDCLQPFCTAATTLSQHQPRSENPRFSHKRGGSRRPIFATCARDQTSFQLPPCRRTGAIGPYRNRSRGPLVACRLSVVAQSWLSQSLSPLRHLLGAAFACVGACLACLRSRGSGESLFRRACSLQPASPRLHSCVCLSNLTSYHRSAERQTTKFLITAASVS